jgi:hypothetical protein
MGYSILDLGDIFWVHVGAEACCDMVRLDPGAEKRPDEESVIKNKHNSLLRNGSRGITVHLKTNKHYVSLTHS